MERVRQQHPIPEVIQRPAWPWQIKCIYLSIDEVKHVATGVSGEPISQTRQRSRGRSVCSNTTTLNEEKVKINLSNIN